MRVIVVPAAGVAAAGVAITTSGTLAVGEVKLIVGADDEVTVMLTAAEVVTPPALSVARAVSACVLASAGAFEIAIAKPQ
jgi:hypothetical protein